MNVYDYIDELETMLHNERTRQALMVGYANHLTASHCPQCRRVYAREG